MRRFRSAGSHPSSVSFCVALVVLPAVCSAAVFGFAVREAGGLAGHSAGVVAEHLHGNLGIGHPPGAASTPAPAPASDHAPEQGAEHCAPHGCCVAAVKHATRQLSAAAPVSFDWSDSGAVVLRSGDVGGSAPGPGSEAPPGTPGLSATCAPQRL